MESSGESFKIQISGVTAKKIENKGYKLVRRGYVSVKVSKIYSLIRFE